jgi:hypothetical protein
MRTYRKGSCGKAPLAPCQVGQPTAAIYPAPSLGAVGRQEEVLTDKAPAPPASCHGGPRLALWLCKAWKCHCYSLAPKTASRKIFARQMDGKMLYNHTRDKWLEWDGTRWQIEATKKALNFARDLARSVNYEGSRSIGSASFCAGVEQLAKADPVLSAKGTEFDRDKLPAKHAGRDVRPSHQYPTPTPARPRGPPDHVHGRNSPAMKAGAAFDKFLGEITMGDRALAEFLQVSLGGVLIGRCGIPLDAVLDWGRAATAKNTLGDLVQDAMGDYARKVPTSTLMAKTHEGHPTEIANLQGIRLALSSEINDGEYWHEARINEVTGDGTLSARFMRGRPLHLPAHAQASDLWQSPPPNCEPWATR